MFAYRYNPETKIYEGTQMCQLDVLESEIAGEEIYLLPADCTYTAPPELKDDFNVVWNGEAWEYVEIPVEPEPETPEPHVPTTEEKIAQLDGQYQSDKQVLQGYYAEFMIAGNTAGMEAIKQELADLAGQYDADLAVLKGGE